MAKDTDESSKKGCCARKQSVTVKRAKHRKISAASSDRKRQAGMVRISLWVLSVFADDLRRCAHRLYAGHSADDAGAIQGVDTRGSAETVLPALARRKRKNQPSDDRQLELFGPP